MFISKSALQEHYNTPSREDLELFVDQNFNSVGSEFEEWEPVDWKPHIPLFYKIKVTLNISTIWSRIYILRVLNVYYCITFITFFNIT